MPEIRPFPWPLTSVMPMQLLPHDDGEAIALQQLRHLTKNALQRIIGQIHASGLAASPAGRELAEDLEERICRSARLSDLLFGLTERPAPLRQRLAVLVESVIAMLAEEEQTLQTEVTIDGLCPPALETVVVQVAHEMLGNAVKHGMRMRLCGRIELQLRCGPGVEMIVRDDGWGPRGTVPGEGLAIMHRLAGRHGGRVTLTRSNGWTVARLLLPHEKG